MASTEEEARELVGAKVNDDRLTRLAERLGATAAASAVFGEPVERDGITVIPVARVRWGVGGGSGRGKKQDSEGFGGGGGVQAEPMGYIDVRGGEATYRRINDQVRVILAVLILPLSMGLAFMMVLLTMALIGRRMLATMSATMGNFRLPLPRLTFRS
jgi:uncharacterized spore protein YtfJ